MAPMTNADESPMNRLTLFPIYLSLFVVSTLWFRWTFVDVTLTFPLIIVNFNHFFIQPAPGLQMQTYLLKIFHFTENTFSYSIYYGLEVKKSTHVCDVTYFFLYFVCCHLNLSEAQLFLN